MSDEILRQAPLFAGLDDDAAGTLAASMSCSPYWRRGMTDEEWRSVKKKFVAAMHGDLA